jgi:chorismate mutase
LNLSQPIISGIDNRKPIVIAGPCSAETEEQVLLTARKISEIGIKVFRAGIWKPRTRPNSFEGVGIKGFEWLNRARIETGLKMAVEVANAWHVHYAIENNIDILWIGARTTVNPFAVQEIADTLSGTKNLTVLVKNPINPDLDLWIGALERLYGAGITRLGAIHRGFSNYAKSIYRNPPNWQIPIELRRRIPQLPIFNDPSHISGKRELVQDLCQMAIDLDYDGLFIETHCDPENAWSDADQQLTVEQLEHIIKNLIPRGQTINDEKIAVSIENMRRKIDKLDEEILQKIEQRMDIAQQIGIFKKAHNITILQSNRWSELLEGRINEGLSKGLSEEFIHKIYMAIHDESIQRQKDIMK